MAPDPWIITEPLAGLQAQALGLAERAGLQPQIHLLRPRAPWRYLTASLWPSPLSVVDIAAKDAPPLIIGAGGMAAAVLTRLRQPGLPGKPGRRVVQIQHPRLPPNRFDLIIANRHDRLTGPNVVVVRTALHRVTQARLAEAAVAWAPRLAHLPRPLVAVLVGGSNGRFRLDAAVAAALADQLAEMMGRDQIGLAITPSRRTAPEAVAALREKLAPLGAYIWDMEGENPYFGLLALADAIIVTQDSVSMISEAVATSAPVLLARLPGRSRRIGAFAETLVAERRAHWFTGRLDMWPVAPLDDTDLAAEEMRQRFGL